MQHTHFDHCESTQTYLVNQIEKLSSGNHLVSTELQTKGRGQKDNTWDSYSNSVCFSFNLNPTEPLTMTSLELGFLVCDFFKINFDTELFLKWPNDILNSQKEKCGGILINNSKHCIAGIGINLFKENNEPFAQYRTKAGTVLNKEVNYSKKEFSLSLATFIHENRVKKNLSQKWQKHCCHLKKKVKIQNQIGIFDNIGTHGEAILKIDNRKESFYSGPLELMDS